MRFQNILAFSQFSVTIGDRTNLKNQARKVHVKTLFRKYHVSTLLNFVVTCQLSQTSDSLSSAPASFHTYSYRVRPHSIHMCSRLPYNVTFQLMIWTIRSSYVTVHFLNWAIPPFRQYGFIIPLHVCSVGMDKTLRIERGIPIP